MAIIDSIPEIQQLLKVSKTDTIKINLTGTPVAGRYPCVNIFINQVCYWQGLVQELTEVNFDELLLGSGSIEIDLQYINKTSQDTKLVGDKIVENQCVQINFIEINQLKLYSHDLINNSSTDYNLTDSETIAYNATDSPWKNVKTDVLYNNGTWKMHLKKPIITTLLKQKSLVYHVFETSHLDVLTKLQQYFK